MAKLGRIITIAVIMFLGPILMCGGLLLERVSFLSRFGDFVYGFGFLLFVLVILVFIREIVNERQSEMWI